MVTILDFRRGKRFMQEAINAHICNPGDQHKIRVFWLVNMSPLTVLTNFKYYTKNRTPLILPQQRHNIDNIGPQHSSYFPSTGRGGEVKRLQKTWTRIDLIICISRDSPLTNCLALWSNECLLLIRVVPFARLTYLKASLLM